MASSATPYAVPRSGYERTAAACAIGACFRGQAAARVREHVDRLERFYDQVIGCHVVVEAPPAHRHKGALFDVKIDLVVPGGGIAVRSERAEHEAHTDVYVALRDAFDSARRLLQDYARERRGDIKHHARRQT